MAKFGVADADKYGSQGGGGFFSLKNDKEVAEIRFLIDGIEDVVGYAVHEVEVDGKKRYVNCLREYGQPMDVCPFCMAKKFVAVKYFIPVYNITDDKVQVWERGKKFGAKISSLCQRYPHTVAHTFDVERNGKPGDTTTTYEIYETSQDETVMEDFVEELPEILGGLVLDKSADDMQYYLDNECFPDENAQPVRRREGGRRDSQETRRTPGSRRGEGF